MPINRQKSRIGRAWLVCLTIALLSSRSIAGQQDKVIVEKPALADSAPIPFVVQGNTLLPPSRVADILAPLPPPVTLEAIQATVDRLRKAYRDSGYGAVVVRLPEQTIAPGGSIRLEVVEGKLGEIYLQGNHAFSDENVLRSLPALKKGQTPNLAAVDSNTQQVSENPAKASHVAFQPGQTAGQVDALVVTDERDPIQYVVGLDNTGNQSTGRYRTSLAFQDANLFGRDQVLGLRGEASPTFNAHSNAGSLSYAAPLYALSSAVELAASYSDVKSKAIPTAAGDAQFAGQGNDIGLRYRFYFPKFGPLRQKIQLGLDVRHYGNECSVGTLGSAGCGAAGASVDVRPFTLAYDANFADNYNANLQFSMNSWTGGGQGGHAAFEQARDGARAQYRVVRGGLNAAYRYRELTLAWRNTFQYSPDALVVGEQFGAGGASSVRGYEERELVGDNGVQSTLELSVPLSLTSTANPRLTSWLLPLQGAVFADWGRVNNNRHAPCRDADSTCDISSVGLGLRWNYHSQGFVHADLARAFEAGPQTEAGHYKVSFALSYGF